jgi:hypothetical protein
MIQFQILTGKMAGDSWSARHFPVRIGRGAENELQLEEAGVWERHLTIEFDPATGFTLRAEPEALVSVNQRPARTQVLQPGDSIEIGSAHLRFWLAEPVRRGLRANEFTIWTLIAAVLGTEIWMLCRLLG